jgi:hypothetical protein
MCVCTGTGAHARLCTTHLRQPGVVLFCHRAPSTTSIPRANRCPLPCPLRKGVDYEGRALTIIQVRKHFRRDLKETKLFCAYILDNMVRGDEGGGGWLVCTTCWWWADQRVVFAQALGSRCVCGVVRLCISRRMRCEHLPLM